MADERQKLQSFLKLIRDSFGQELDHGDIDLRDQCSAEMNRLVTEKELRDAIKDLDKENTGRGASLLDAIRKRSSKQKLLASPLDQQNTGQDNQNPADSNEAGSPAVTQHGRTGGEAHDAPKPPNNLKRPGIDLEETADYKRARAAGIEPRKAALPIVDKFSIYSGIGEDIQGGVIGRVATTNIDEQPEFFTRLSTPGTTSRTEAHIEAAEHLDRAHRAEGTKRKYHSTFRVGYEEDMRMFIKHYYRVDTEGVITFQIETVLDACIIAVHNDIKKAVTAFAKNKFTRQEFMLPLKQVTEPPNATLAVLIRAMASVAERQIKSIPEELAVLFNRSKLEETYLASTLSEEFTINTEAYEELFVNPENCLWRNSTQMDQYLKNLLLVFIEMRSKLMGDIEVDFLTRQTGWIYTAAAQQLIKGQQAQYALKCHVSAADVLLKFVKELPPAYACHSDEAKKKFIISAFTKVWQFAAVKTDDQIAKDAAATHKHSQARLHFPYNTAEQVAAAAAGNAAAEAAAKQATEAASRAAASAAAAAQRRQAPQHPKDKTVADIRRALEQKMKAKNIPIKKLKCPFGAECKFGDKCLRSHGSGYLVDGTKTVQENFKALETYCAEVNPQPPAVTTTAGAGAKAPGGKKKKRGGGKKSKKGVKTPT